MSSSGRTCFNPWARANPYRSESVTSPLAAMCVVRNSRKTGLSCDDAKGTPLHDHRFETAIQDDGEYGIFKTADKYWLINEPVVWPS